MRQPLDDMPGYLARLARVLAERARERGLAVEFTPPDEGVEATFVVRGSDLDLDLSDWWREVATGSTPSPYGVFRRTRGPEMVLLPLNTNLRILTPTLRGKPTTELSGDLQHDSGLLLAALRGSLGAWATAAEGMLQ